MRSYLLSILGASLIAGVVETAVPEGENGGLKKALRTVSALILLCVILSPVKNDGFSLEGNFFDSLGELLAGEEGSY